MTSHSYSSVASVSLIVRHILRRRSSSSLVVSTLPCAQLSRLLLLFLHLPRLPSKLGPCLVIVAHRRSSFFERGSHVKPPCPPDTPRSNSPPPSLARSRGSLRLSRSKRSKMKNKPLNAGDIREFLILESHQSSSLLLLQLSSSSSLRISTTSRLFFIFSLSLGRARIATLPQRSSEPRTRPRRLSK